MGQPRDPSPGACARSHWIDRITALIHTFWLFPPTPWRYSDHAPTLGANAPARSLYRRGRAARSLLAGGDRRSRAQEEMEYLSPVRILDAACWLLQKKRDAARSPLPQTVPFERPACD